MSNATPRSTLLVAAIMQGDAQRFCDVVRRTGLKLRCAVAWDCRITRRRNRHLSLSCEAS